MSKKARAAWKGMKERCDNPNRANYPYYGGRGIDYPIAWEKFSAFYADMGDCPEGLSLERRDNNANYSKANCYWATKEEQSWNKNPYKNSPMGIKGVQFHKASNRWVAVAGGSKDRERLYSGTDFFEACCARKSWEAKTNFSMGRSA